MTLTNDPAEDLMYRAVPVQVDLPALERDMLDFWRQHDIFRRSLAQTAGATEWVFYEGPPTANGMPGTHHIEARVFKDVFPRFKTMKGYHVRRKAGWDCHGLPVEIAVEKELGFSGKRDIEAYGIAEFNERCRESVGRHTDAFVKLTERMGYWVDMEDAYWTMSAEYIDSVWWSLKKIFDDGLLVEDFRVAPWCPRCETGLSDHELAQGYETVSDPSAFVRFPLASGPLAGIASMLVWTTTPWTLVSNVAVAVNPEISYDVVTDGVEQLVIAATLVEAALGDGWKRTGDRFKGADMEGWAYRRPFDLVPIDGGSRTVLGAHVTTEDGSGLVHIAPAFGADDLAVSRANNLPFINPIKQNGRFGDDVPLVGGRFFKAADRILLSDLAERGLVARELDHEHSYPHCWRCHTPLLYYAHPTWYVRTTAVRDALLRENEKTRWQPETVKHGRYGEWVRNNVDWALSRTRYWGTPLPIWRCEEGHLTCVGSRAELGRLADSDLTRLDPHRPFIDEVVLTCECGRSARRVPEVIDAWYDSGAMPFAQFGYPYANKEMFERHYPAQFISEAIDQTRGWFYTLMAVGTLVFDRSPYENVVCLGLILAEDGRKMSKHLGNTLEPIPLLEEHGADAVRWFMAAVGSPWSSRRVGHKTLQAVVRKTLLTYWNTAAFHVLYARAAGWMPSAHDPVPRERPLLDRWVLSELQKLVAQVDAAMEDFDTHAAGKRLATFIDGLSNWYVRRTRRRFWHGDAAALATLHDVLRTLTLLMAPITPFMAERLWQDMVVPVEEEQPQSVHLAAYPAADRSLIDPSLGDQVCLARRLVELGRSARSTSGVKTRQPLAGAVVSAVGFDDLPRELVAEIAAELNVTSVEPMADLVESLISITVKPNFRALGKRFGNKVQAVALAISTADASAVSTALSGSGSVIFDVDGQPVTLGDGDVIVTRTPRSGWAIAADATATVGIDVEITAELREAGVAREVIRLIQQARKTAGFDISDRINLRYRSDRTDTEEAITNYRDLIAAEVLAANMTTGAPVETGLIPFDDSELGLKFWIERC